MSKKLTRKEKIALQRTTGSVKPEQVTSVGQTGTVQSEKSNPANRVTHSGLVNPANPAKSSNPSISSNPANHLARHKKNILIIGLIIAVLGFLLYSNTLHYDYTLDDFSLIKENFQTKKGTAALKEIFTSSYRAGYYLPDNDLYRPLSKAMFAIEWQLAPDKPSLSHWVNVILYSITGFLLFYVLLLYLPDKMLLCTISSLLFIAHPIHTEVVASIKSRDEILSFLFFLLMALFSFKYVQKSNFIWLLAAAIAFFLCLLSKESGITFLAAIPLMIFFFTDSTLKKQGAIVVVLTLTVVLFFAFRAKILGGGININPSVMDNLLVASHNKLYQITTAISILGIYLKLLFFPHPLVSDYSFNQIPIVGLTDWQFILSLIIFLGLGIFALLKFRQKTIYAFGILFFLITISVASNIVMLIGTSFGERLMYAPSLGFCIVGAGGILQLFKVEAGDIPDKIKNKIMLNLFIKKNAGFSVFLGIILLLYVSKTYSRNQAWKDNYTLHSTDVLLSPNSARAHYYYGNIITQDEYLAKIKDSRVFTSTLDTAMKEMRRTIQIYPVYADAFHKIGKIFLIEKNLDSAAFYYKKALLLNPGNSMYLNNYGTVLFNKGLLDEALQQFELSLKTNPNQSDTWSNIGSVYGTRGQQLAAQNKTDESHKNFETAVLDFKKCIELSPDYAPGYSMLSMTYKSIGDEANAQYFSDMAKKLNSRVK